MLQSYTLLGTHSLGSSSAYGLSVQARTTHRPRSSKDFSQRVLKFIVMSFMVSLSFKKIVSLLLYLYDIHMYMFIYYICCLFDIILLQRPSHKNLGV